jgi:DNA helicase HerA-like ATPase
MKRNSIASLTRDAILRIGEVVEVNGRKIYVAVDSNKNLTDIFYDGKIIKNISVNGCIDIRKGFLSIIGRVDGERIENEYPSAKSVEGNPRGQSTRILSITLLGYINAEGKFIGGTKELPLIGNEAFILTQDKVQLIYNLLDAGGPSINIATSDNENVEIKFPIDGLFNSHIAIFGNTGSGKSNTLAIMYQELYSTMKALNESQFKEKIRFVLFDFNGEYSNVSTITPDKKVFNLSTQDIGGDKIPMTEEDLLDIENISILSDATEKTQKPFIKRALVQYRRHSCLTNPEEGAHDLLRELVYSVLQMSDKVRAYLLLDYLAQILPDHDSSGVHVNLNEDLDWHNLVGEFRLKKSGAFCYLSSDPKSILDSFIYKHIDSYSLPNDALEKIIHFLYFQLIKDVLSNRAQNEHIAPAINKLKSKQSDIRKIFDATSDNFWESNFVVINLHNVNLDMKKTVPLLLSKKLYLEQKHSNAGMSLSIIIDEAHNILSKDSSRESESWKDYRLETFEEIIKEGRKFGTFVTIASQRPSDISHTITSQAHNYFIHRLVNQHDLLTISSAVSYIDRVTEESIPTLPTGTCVFSGVATQIPLKININELPNMLKPSSETLCFSQLIQSS